MYFMYFGKKQIDLKRYKNVLNKHTFLNLHFYLVRINNVKIYSIICQYKVPTRNVFSIRKIIICEPIFKYFTALNLGVIFLTNIRVQNLSSSAF